MVVLGLSLAVLRTIYLDAVPPTVLAHDAAAVLYDTLVAYLRLGLRTILVLALVIAGGAFLTGPSTTAVRTRQRLTAGIGRLRGGAEQAGWRTARSGPGSMPTSRCSASAPSPWPRSPWSSRANPPARPSWCWPGCYWSPSP